MTQLDLFPARAASIVPFPLARRASLVRDVAATISGLSYDAGRSFWRQHLRDQRRALQQAGVPVALIRSEAQTYAQTVGHHVMAILEGHKRPNEA